MDKFKPLLFSGLFALSCVPASAFASVQSIDDYIYGLKYDPRNLLSVREDGSTESLPGRQAGRENVIICTNNKRGLDKELSDVTVLSPTSGVVYPGALVRANRSLAEGKPEAITLPRAPITVRVDLPGIGAAGIQVINNPANSSVQSALDTILEAWNKQAAAEGYVNASRSSLSIQKAFSKEQIALSLGFSSKWASNQITSNLSVKNSSTSSTTLALFRQIFYTATMDLAASPSAVFDSGVGLDRIKTQVSANDPPGYVKSVDYGRIVLLRMDTAGSESETDLEGTLKFVSGSGAEVDSDTKNKFTRIANNSKFTVMVLGGNAEAATKVMGPGDLSELLPLIRENGAYKRSNPGYPIAYTVSFLKDNRIATMAFSTDYIDSDCKEYPNGFVKMSHSGAYVAKWQVNWQQKSPDGSRDVPMSWESGEKTAGWQQTLGLPGDAHSVRIQAWAATGLVWDPWGEAIHKVINGPDNKCYRITGTTLGRSWDNNCN